MQFLISLESVENRSSYDFAEIATAQSDYAELKNAAMYVAFLKNPKIFSPNSDFLINSNDFLSTN